MLVFNSNSKVYFNFKTIFERGFVVTTIRSLVINIRKGQVYDIGEDKM